MIGNSPKHSPQAAKSSWNGAVLTAGCTFLPSNDQTKMMSQELTPLEPIPNTWRTAFKMKDVINYLFLLSIVMTELGVIDMQATGYYCYAEPDSVQRMIRGLKTQNSRRQLGTRFIHRSKIRTERAS